MTARAKLRLALSGLIIGVLLLGVGGWALLNTQVYSASGFVSQYLSALARHDAGSALSMPGVTDDLPSDASTALLRSSALGELTDVRIGATRSAGADTIVEATFTAGGVAGQSQFVVHRTGSTFGIFDSWAFSQRPLSTIAVKVSHGVQFQVGTSGVIDLRTTKAEKLTDWGGTQSFLVFAPGAYSFSLDSAKLVASPTTGTVTTPGQSASVTVDLQPTAAFTAQVQKEINEYLDQCVTQHVLQPSGCPFGYQTGNRIVGEPSWAMVDYPVVTVSDGAESWVVRKAVGRARITGEIQSLYDGSVSRLDKVISFSADMNIVVRPDGSLSITLV